MVHAHFRPFLRQVHKFTLTEHHPVFSLDQLFPNESVPPIANETLLDFIDGCDWTPSRSPRECFNPPSNVLPPGATTNIPLAAAASTANPSVTITSEDTDKIDSGNCRSQYRASQIGGQFQCFVWRVDVYLLLHLLHIILTPINYDLI